MKKTKVLLTGASGAVGSEVLTLLVQNIKDYEVVTYDRPSPLASKRLAPFEPHIAMVWGDITDKDSLAKACQDIDVCIHLAAIIPPLSDEKPELAYQVNAQGTACLVEALETYSKQAFLLFSSSVAIYGDRLADPYIQVGDPINPGDHDVYAKSKVAAEAIIRQSQLRWSIFRLTAILGIRNHKMSNILFHMPLNTLLEFVTPWTCARAFYKAISYQDELNYRVFNLGGGEKCRTTYQEFLNDNFHIFGLGKPKFSQYSFAEKNFH